MTGFKSKWVVDYEFLAGGDIPHPICYVAQNPDTGELIRHWITGNETMPEYPVDDESLFTAYYASAEMGCHIALNFPKPLNILDLYTEFRCATNGKKLPSGRGLIGALNYYGLSGGDADYKDMMRERILQGPPFTEIEKEQILDYCQKDVELTAKLYQHMINDIDMSRALFRGRYMWAVAMMEHYGVPIDMDKFNILSHEWGNIKGKLIERVDKDFGVYEGTVFKAQKFREYLQRNNIPWDLTDTGLPKLDDDYMRDQAKTCPQLKPLQELRYSLGQLKLTSLQIGKDGRNRALLSPFQSITGRNQPSSSKFIFGPAVWLRNLIRPSEGMAISYVDYEQQEIAIAAYLSGDEALINAYESGDPYVSFARAAGAIPEDGDKNTHPEIREKFKICMLALNYGMSVETFARRSGLPLIEARHMFKMHKQTYHQYWEWVSLFTDIGMLSGKIETRWGWPCHTTEMKYRSMQNWPMQAHGANILQLAIILCLENKIRVVAPVHDAILIESPASKIDEDIKTAQFLMAKASEYVIGHTIRTEAKTFRYPDHYTDKRGAMWNDVWAIIGGGNNG